MSITKREAAIISAYTGVMLGKFGDMQAYAEEVLGQPIWTHEFESKELVERLREKSRPDFVALDVDA